MKNTVGMFIAGLVLFASMAEAQTTFSPVALTPKEGCAIVSIEGERVPFPLRNANTKFALADGETYLLNGTLVLLSGKVFLNVDLVSQPWLATPNVVANPFFEVSSIDATSVIHYKGQFVQVAVVANRVANSANVREMKLDSILPPAANNTY